MAFVFRSEKPSILSKQSISSQNDSNEYVDANKGKEQNFVPFNSQANRFVNCSNAKDDYTRNVGPFSYSTERSSLLKKSFSSKQIDSLNGINQTMLSMIQKAKKDHEEQQQLLSQKIEGEPKSKQNSSRMVNQTKASNSIESNNNHSYLMKSKQLIRLLDTTHTSNRICSIPSKTNNFGYDVDPSNDVIMLNEDPNKAVKYSGLNNDSVSPCYYYIDKTKKPKGIDWSRSSIKMITKDYNNSNSSNTIQNNNDFNDQSTSLRGTELPINVRNSSNLNSHSHRPDRNNHNKPTQSHSMSTLSLKRPMMKINKSPRKSNEEKDFLDEISLVPGPGYYFDENIKYSFQKHSYNTGTFPKAKRKNIISDQDINTMVGPSSYQNNANTIKKPNYYPMFHREENILASTAKIDSNPYLGPGSYILDKIIFKNPGSKYYGSLDRRFPLKSKFDQPKPGPGEYLDIDQWGKKEFIPPKYSVEKDPYDNHLPGIGSYNPSIVSSIEYKLKNKENKLQSQRAPFNIAEKRFHISHSTNNIVGPGPGCYIHHKEWGKDEKIISESINKGNGDGNQNNIGSIPGPGSYDTADIKQWNKKSFNVLFV